MNKLPAEQLMELMFLGLNDAKVIETLDKLDIEQPILDEQYEIDGRLSVVDEKKSGLTIVFKKPSGYSQTGEPEVEQIDFYEDKKILFPFNISKTDDYQAVIKKIGRKPDYCSRILETNKQWVFSYKDKEIVYAIHFKNNFIGFYSIVVGEFEREGIEDDPFIFPCEKIED